MKYLINLRALCRLTVIGFLMAFSFIASSAFGDLALTISTSNRCEDFGSDSSYGWQFTVNTAVDVTDLGVWDRYARFGPDTAGLNESHLVTIWNSSGSVLVQATVPAGTNNTLVDVFRYVSLPTPVRLGPGTYTISAYYNGSSAGDYVAYCADPIVTAPQLSYNNGMFWFGSGPPPAYAPDQSQGYFGPNFLFQPTAPPPPEIVTLSVDPTVVGKNGYATFTISRARTGNSPLTVNYSMSGTAVLGTDYVLDGTPNQVTIPERGFSTTVEMSVVTTKTKGSERAVMTLQPGSGYAFSSRTHSSQPSAAVRIDNK